MPRGGQNAIPEADLIQALRDLATQLGRSPSQNDINEHSPHSHKTYYRKFDGGLAEAKERAGLEMYDQQGRVRVQIKCAQCGKTAERRPSDIEGDEYHFCSPECHYKHNRKRYRGEGNPSWNRVEVTCDNCGDIRIIPKWSAERYANNFCGKECYADWRSELMAGGYAPLHDREFPSGSDHFRYKGDKITYTGPNWFEQRRRAIIRDQARCQEPGCDETGRTQTDKHGHDISVHHITPREEFWDGEEFDYEAANELDNLICLCRSHHRQRHN